jgi:hypothetical protein
MIFSFSVNQVKVNNCLRLNIVPLAYSLYYMWCGGYQSGVQLNKNGCWGLAQGAPCFGPENFGTFTFDLLVGLLASAG